MTSYTDAHPTNTNNWIDLPNNYNSQDTISRIDEQNSRINNRFQQVFIQDPMKVDMRPSATKYTHFPAIINNSVQVARPVIQQDYSFSKKVDDESILHTLNVPLGSDRHGLGKNEYIPSSTGNLYKIDSHISCSPNAYLSMPHSILMTPPNIGLKSSTDSIKQVPIGNLLFSNATRQQLRSL